MSATITATDAVFAVLHDGTKVRVTDALPWRDAVDRWHKLDDARRAGSNLVRFYAVRSIEDPEWADAIKWQTRTVNGVKLIKNGDKSWITPCGEYEVVYEANNGVTYCEDEHPVKLTPEIREDVLRHERLKSDIYPSSAYWATIEGKKGYKCPGGCEHSVSEWTARKLTGNADVLGWGATLAEAAYRIPKNTN